MIIRITKGMTNEQKFRAMWRQMAHSGCTKEQTVIDQIFPCYNSCHACAEASSRNSDSDSDYCPFCPIDWGAAFCLDKGTFTLYKKWCRASYRDDKPEMKRLAAIIAKLSWKTRTSA
jgi:hypothetical protein